MIYILTQEHNSNKHALMPSGYPWQVQNVAPTNDVDSWTSVEDEIALATLMASFDMTPYLAAIEEELRVNEHDAKRAYGNMIMDEFIEKMVLKDMQLIHDGTTVDRATIVSQNVDLKNLAEIGTLAPIVTLANERVTLYPVYAEIYQWLSSTISSFLTERGYA